MLCTYIQRLSAVTKLVSNSRLHCEDVLSLVTGNHSRVYFRDKKRVLQTIFGNDTIFDATAQQQKHGVRGELLSIGGTRLFALLDRVTRSEFNRKAISGELEKEFQCAFSNGQGITVEFVHTSTRDGTQMRKLIFWKTVLAWRNTVYFVGLSTNLARRYWNLFYVSRKITPLFVKQIFGML